MFTPHAEGSSCSTTQASTVHTNLSKTLLYELAVAACVMRQLVHVIYIVRVMWAFESLPDCAGAPQN